MADQPTNPSTDQLTNQRTDIWAHREDSLPIMIKINNQNNKSVTSRPYSKLWQTTDRPTLSNWPTHRHTDISGHRGVTLPIMIMMIFICGLVFILHSSSGILALQSLLTPLPLLPSPPDFPSTQPLILPPSSISPQPAKIKDKGERGLSSLCHPSTSSALDSISPQFDLFICDPVFQSDPTFQLWPGFYSKCLSFYCDITFF